jgi:hypothetical protein
MRFSKPRGRHRGTHLESHMTQQTRHPRPRLIHRYQPCTIHGGSAQCVYAVACLSIHKHSKCKRYSVTGHARPTRLLPSPPTTPTVGSRERESSLLTMTKPFVLQKRGSRILLVPSHCIGTWTCQCQRRCVRSEVRTWRNANPWLVQVPPDVETQLLGISRNDEAEGEVGASRERDDKGPIRHALLAESLTSLQQSQCTETWSSNRHRDGQASILTGHFEIDSYSVDVVTNTPQCQLDPFGTSNTSVQSCKEQHYAAIPLR